MLTVSGLVGLVIPIFFFFTLLREKEEEEEEEDNTRKTERKREERGKKTSLCLSYTDLNVRLLKGLI